VTLGNCNRGHNPFAVDANNRLGLNASPSPRVAEYGNPGLRDATPFGVADADSWFASAAD
jgi:hypothetical protein